MTLLEELNKQKNVLNQSDLIDAVSMRPQNFMWFLGAGTSRAAGLPTALDIIWDLKRRYYCREENQDIAQHDVQNEAIRERIQNFMDARGFPPEGTDGEYGAYFEKIFGVDKERQRQYLKRTLSEEKVSLSVGNRVLGALLSSGLTKIVFTTNFDSVVETSVAKMGGRAVSAFHLEGSHAANSALNNEEFPVYCKLHGDFRYDSIKNLSTDLAQQNNELANCMINAATRFGLIVVGYSGRDLSIMNLLHNILEHTNAFPHGIFWTGLKGVDVSRSVHELLQQANSKGVNSNYVEIDTFDSMMLRLWRNIDNKPANLNSKVQRTTSTTVSIPLSSSGSGKPLLRLNALPVRKLPDQCLSLKFKEPKDWTDLAQASRDSEGQLIFSKAEAVWCWGRRETIMAQFGDDLVSISELKLPQDFTSPQNLHIKRFLERAMIRAITREHPLLSRLLRSSSYLITGSRAEDIEALDPLRQVVGETSGIVRGLFSMITDKNPQPEQVQWSEAARVSLNMKRGAVWFLIEPDVWIWPKRSRREAVNFLKTRRRDRFNRKYNELLTAWVHIILGTVEKNVEVDLKTFNRSVGIDNPAFILGSRTAYTQKLES